MVPLDPVKRALLRNSVFVLLLLLAGCGFTPSLTNSPTPAKSSPPPATATTVSYSPLFSTHYLVTLRPDVTYGPDPLETLDLCTPSGANGSFPGVVLIHGGSSDIGDKRAEYDTLGDDLQSACMGLASQGFVVASINYRLTSVSRWPAQIIDAQLAVRWLRTNAASIGLDRTRICSAGFSSGAHLAVFLGVMQANYPGDNAHLLASESSQVSCVLDFYGPVDFVNWVKTTPDSLAEVRDFFGKEDTDLFRSASPFYRVSAHSSPMLIVQGTHDSTVPVEQSQELLQKLQEQHVAVQYISYDGDHAFEGLQEDQIRAIWTEAVAFLTAHMQA